MTGQFFEQPILNSPYAAPTRHWELDDDGQPTNRTIAARRAATFVTPVPKPRKRRQHSEQQALALADPHDLSDEQQQYDSTSIIQTVRRYIDEWRLAPPDRWEVTPTTARLLHYWRQHHFQGIRPFFCQIEAVETAIWLAEVAPKRAKPILDHLHRANADANPDLFRIALKLATGAGKTTVMAMLIAWQTLNAVRHPQRSRFTRAFLIVTPGITIKDRLRVLLPNDPDSYFTTRELVPSDMQLDMQHARVVITNYHAFKLRERLPLSAGNRALLQGHGSPLQTLETEGQMVQRVLPELMGFKRVLVLNDEAHHCYRARVADADPTLKGDDKQEAEKNNEAARLWISGLEIVQRILGLQAVYDLSATPFFLRGSGYAEGTLFPWTVSDFSLMDAIECGIVKLPRVPVADNVPGGEMPRLRNLWEHIGKHLPRAGRSKTGSTLDPLSLPAELLTALDALYGHYAKTFELWQAAGIAVPPVFIVVCNNTATSKLVHDYIAGFTREHPDGSSTYHAGRLALFRNFDEHGNRLPQPRTLLIDSEQLESDEAFDPAFRAMSADAIARFRRELIARTGNQAAGEQISDQALLREVMNTVGKAGKLGETVRCVVSVSMLTEGWDANTVTHVLGVRAFGTQLLCEQVVGRALRRQSYDLDENGLLPVEYADVLGIPFDFTAKPVVVKPTPPRQTVQVRAVLPDRAALELTFPRVIGYRTELPPERLAATFSPDSRLVLNPDLVGPSITLNAGIIGEQAELNLSHLEETRQSTIIYHLTRYLLTHHFRDPNGDPQLYLFGQLKHIVRQWLDGYLVCTGNTYPAQLLYQVIAEMACERIYAAITRAAVGQHAIHAVLDPYTPTGSTQYVNFATAKASRWQADPRRCQINWVVLDSDWEAEFCRVAEAHPRVRAYVKNHGLGLEVPYLLGGTKHTYLPDFLVQLDDGKPDPLNLIVEIKGYRGTDAQAKAETMQTYWIPGVNNLGSHGRWAFAEFTAVYEIADAFDALVQQVCAAAPPDTL